MHTIASIFALNSFDGIILVLADPTSLVTAFIYIPAGTEVVDCIIVTMTDLYLKADKLSYLIIHTKAIIGLRNSLPCYQECLVIMYSVLDTITCVCIAGQPFLFTLTLSTMRYSFKDWSAQVEVIFEMQMDRDIHVIPIDVHIRI